jgi:hypothetical protein
MAKTIKQEKGNKTPVDEGVIIYQSRNAKNAMMALYKAEKTQGFEPDFDWEDWPEADGDLDEEELGSLFYEMSIEVDVQDRATTGYIR